jgi:hypothetical protein
VRRCPAGGEDDDEDRDPGDQGTGEEQTHDRVVPPPPVDSSPGVGLCADFRSESCYMPRRASMCGTVRRRIFTSVHSDQPAT